MIAKSATTQKSQNHVDRCISGQSQSCHIFMVWEAVLWLRTLSPLASKLPGHQTSVGLAHHHRSQGPTGNGHTAGSQQALTEQWATSASQRISQRRECPHLPTVSIHIFLNLFPACLPSLWFQEKSGLSLLWPIPPPVFWPLLPPNKSSWWLFPILSLYLQTFPTCLFLPIRMQRHSRPYHSVKKSFSSYPLFSRVLLLRNLGRLWTLTHFLTPPHCSDSDTSLNTGFAKNWSLLW